MIVLLLYGTESLLSVNPQKRFLKSLQMSDPHIKKENATIYIIDQEKLSSFIIKITPQNKLYTSLKNSEIYLSSPNSFDNSCILDKLCYALEYYLNMELRLNITFYTNHLQEIYCLTRIYELYVEKKLINHCIKHNGLRLFKEIKLSFHSFLSKRTTLLNEIMTMLVPGYDVGKTILTTENKELMFNADNLIKELINKANEIDQHTENYEIINPYEVILTDLEGSKLIRIINNHERFWALYNSAFGKETFLNVKATIIEIINQFRTKKSMSNAISSN